ncbi:GGDEF domain-containing response regulator [Pseudidiomarina aquimaris]|uniref:GGDEF domain-containing response regulator n=1 Tax=Pseudidiomarina aquimaris TaxID=641841 RepID=A0A432XPJ6_9GAMM|nr:GGDEF domain-containing response regulator [Pseudidiomarina aquimaris]RUO50620.1 GGDEF domain-containing response regulator [Pseudidiomarina aquimaris]
MNVLIIDDDTVDRLATKKVLKDSELRVKKVTEATTANEGLEHAKNGDYDLILLDYQLPPTNGIEVLRELRGTNDSSAAMVMISHSNDEELAVRCIEAGAQDFLMKGEVTAARLKRSVLLATERYELERQIQASHDQLKRLAEQDSLTGLTNRYYFDEALKYAIPRANREGTNILLLMIDLDRFKNINDTLGHQAGDSLLKQVAQRLRTPLRGDDKISRLGGDEFAIMVESLEHANDARMLVNRLLEEFEQPFLLEGDKVRVSASIGVATYPECGSNAVELMKSADVAMYRAKGAGRGQAQYYSRDFHEQIEKRARLESDLVNALEKQQFVLHYQPQVDRDGKKLIGIEALIRWQHPELGMIPPDEFISIAEESNFINELGRWVIKSACAQFRVWLDEFALTDISFSVAVNLSAKQLKDKGLIDYCRTCIEHYCIPANRFELELTESNLVTSLEAVDTLNELANIGVELALDDFGTGYSSLSHLKDYPFTILKIDKMFVQSAESGQDDSMLKAVCAFAKSLNYKTVAEGIETAYQHKMCVDLEVDRLQGFYFSKPLAASELKQQWLLGQDKV